MAAEISEAAAANASTLRSTPISCCRGSPVGLSATRNLTPQVASKTPAAPPTNASIKLSVNLCRTTRPVVAPSAFLIAISRCCADARASDNAARFEQAIKRTKPTDPSNTQRAMLTLPTISSRSWTNRTPVFLR